MKIVQTVPLLYEGVQFYVGVPDDGEEHDVWTHDLSKDLGFFQRFTPGGTPFSTAEEAAAQILKMWPQWAAEWNREHPCSTSTA